MLLKGAVDRAAFFKSIDAGVTVAYVREQLITECIRRFSRERVVGGSEVCLIT